MSFPLSSTGAGDYFSSATPRYRNPSSTYLFQYTCLKLQPSSLICIFTYPARSDVFCGSQGFFANPSSGLCFFSPPLQKVPCGLSSAPSLSFPPWVCSSYYRRLCTPSAGFASGVGAQGGTFHDYTWRDGKGPHGLVACRPWGVEDKQWLCIGFCWGFFFVNRKHHFFSGLCLVETTNKRGSTQLEMIDVQKGNIFLPSRYILGGEKWVEETE